MGIFVVSMIFIDLLVVKGKLGDMYYLMLKWNFDKIYVGLIWL